ncbi:TonB-dependent receptor plug domain-containing protein [Aquabacterium sp.]|uniref:TonB-dependent receptor plug domain-containing protein n=1 Tax=Aquabacterium sp. TaxID=1872578 RepID=UPI002A363243|nr:TonB-dependent receptor [Aquabacterium sp.]
MLGLSMAGLAGLGAHADERAPTEEDYFAQLPVVLTASRLDQPLNEAPGAMTVIDRDTIRQSGARTVAELLRLVPGYVLGGWNGANPLASYHVALDDYGGRNLVLIDGRSVYASSYLGDTHRGMMDVLLPDIERIEVLRGANSAAYGANAMFGVVNIITRHSVDTVGGAVALSVGDNGIRDTYARLGVGTGGNNVRLSVGEQRDRGYLNAFDDKRLGQVHLRADFQPTLADEVMVALAASELLAGQGYGPTDPSSPYHQLRSRTTHGQFEWRRQLDERNELQVSLSYMEDRQREPMSVQVHVSPFPPISLDVDYGTWGQRHNVEVQQRTVWSPTWRTLVGVGYKDERALSDTMYYGQGWVSMGETRLFGTAEWRVDPAWLLNAGLFMGDHTLAGTYTAPRLMVNWLATPHQTWRLGVTESIRAPSLSEYKSDVRVNLPGTPYFSRAYAASGAVQPETLLSQEIGYLGRWPEAQVTLDARLYRERMRDVVVDDNGDGTAPLPYQLGKTRDFVNRLALTLVGLEYQLRWKATPRTELWLNQNFSRLKWDAPDYEAKEERRPPRHATTVALFQQLPDNWQISLLHERVGSMTLRAKSSWMATTHRTDLRLGRTFRWGGYKAEAAFTVQSVEGDQLFFDPQRNYRRGRQGFLTLQLEM